MRRIVLVLLLACTTTVWAQSFYQGRSESLIVTTDAGDGATRDLMNLFAQQRAAVAEVLHKSKLQTPTLISVIAVRDAESLRKAVPAFPADSLPLFTHGIERESLVFKLPAQTDAAQADYSRALLAVNYPATPKWFDYGFGAYLGTLRVVSDGVEIGRPPASPSTQDWVQVLNVMANDAPDNAQWRYESWLLVDWIIENSRLEDAGKYFYLTMNRQLPVADALKQAFNTTPQDFERDLQAWVAEAPKHVRKLATSTLLRKETYDISKLGADATITVASALLDDTDRSESRPAAMKALQAVMHNTPDNVAAHRALAYGAMVSGDAPGALEHARRAIALQDNDPMMHYVFAVAANGGDATTMRSASSEAMFNGAINAALRLDSNFAPAFELRGLALQAGGKDAEALKALGHAAALRPRNDQYLLALGRAQAESGDWDNARVLFAMLEKSSDGNIASAAADELKAGKRVKQEQKHWQEQGIYAGGYKDVTDPRWKPTPEMEARNKAEEEEKSAAGPDTRKTEFLDGMLTAVDCTNDPGAILSVKSGAKTWKLNVADRKSVVLIGPDHFSCTWTQKRVHVNYKASGASSGDVVSLEMD